MPDLPSKPDALTPVEDAVVDLARLGLAGDMRAVRQRTRNLLRGGRNAPLREEVRSYLGQLLAELEPVAPALRRGPSAPPVSFPPPATDHDGATEETALPGSALVEVDLAADAVAPMLDSEAADVLDRLLKERRAADRLRQAGVAPSRTLLLSGPPGTGKSMTARFLAQQLGVPLLRTQPAAVMSSLMGQSSRNLRELFRSTSEQPAVLLLDEFDAYARRRDDTQDIAEPKRMVNALLMELDAWPDRALLVAATNHPHLLDPAIARRFEVRLTLQLPSLATRRRVIEQALEETGRHVDQTLTQCCALATEGHSGSDLVTLARAAVRTAVLDEAPLEATLTDTFIRGRLLGRDRATSAARQQFALAARQHTGMSLRAIGDVLGVSHAAVSQMIKQAERNGTGADTERGTHAIA